MINFRSFFKLCTEYFLSSEIQNRNPKTSNPWRAAIARLQRLQRSNAADSFSLPPGQNSHKALQPIWHWIPQKSLGKRKRHDTNLRLFQTYEWISRNVQAISFRKISRLLCSQIDDNISITRLWLWYSNIYH